MKIELVEAVLFERKGALKTVESVINEASNVLNKMKYYKCKRYKTQICFNPIFEIGIYFKVINNSNLSKNLEFKIIFDAFATDKEIYFKKYDIIELKQLLQNYNIDNVDYICNKVVENINHNYF